MMLSGVLSGGVCTETALNVEVPANTIFVAGAVVWKNAAMETCGVPDDDTSYVWGCADGQLRYSDAIGTQPPGFTGSLSCLLCEAVAASGVLTINNAVQWKARTADHTNHFTQEGGGVKRRSVNLSFASDANKTLQPWEYQAEVLNIGSGTTLTATRNLVVPNIPDAVWHVINNATGAQSVQVIMASGTGITIATGKAAMVRCNGTNIERMTADVTP